MTRLATPVAAGKHIRKTRGSVWVRTRMEGTDLYTLTVLDRKSIGILESTSEASICAYAKLTILDSGAIMAFFPLSAMVSVQAKLLMGATWFELAEPLVLPAFVFGFDIEIPAGRHPLVFILESWVVLFRPNITSAIIIQDSP
ncbi:MAG: hypothetical protein JNN28_18365 [Saprospiraceae bacterium]|nr:hypothetical protein [Saprospiraceae bacterium]